MIEYRSWGLKPDSNSVQISLPEWSSELQPAINAAESYIPFGKGKSYGDICFNTGGSVISTKNLDRCIEFDHNLGTLICESGTSISQILDVIVPRGWFVPVVPGTSEITIGGAIANDIHGKNHFSAGSFGHHVDWIEIRRSEGTLVRCSRTENPDLFSATVGGLGLTGMIVRAKIMLKRVTTNQFVTESVPLRNLDDFFQVDSDSRSQHEYTVAWIDTFSKGTSLGRGIYYRGNHSAIGYTLGSAKSREVKIDVPAWWRWNLFSTFLIRVLSAAKYYKETYGAKVKVIPFRKFLFPLDSIRNWNRFYGSSGLLQFQCVLPSETAKSSIKDILKVVQLQAGGSHLCVLKSFGEMQSVGLISFSMPGYTLAMDFPNTKKNRDLLMQLNQLVTSLKGRIYLAKDCLLTADQFAKQNKNHLEFRSQIDPKCSSDMWRRLCKE